MKALVIVLTLAATLASVEAAAEPQIAIGSDSIGPGGTATVDLTISGLTSGTALGSFDLNVGFNSGVVGFGSAIFGDPVLGDQLNLEGYGTISSVTPGAGTVDLFELSLDSASALTSSQASSFTLAQLTFNAVSTGASQLALSVNAVGDQMGNSLSTALHDGSINVSLPSLNAPEIDPTSATSALSLLLGGLLVLRGRQSRAPGPI